MGLEINSQEAKVVLRNYFEQPYEDAVAAARTCYSPRVIESSEVSEDQKKRIAKGTFDGGHHTVFQHATFEFGLENVSRNVVWFFLHSHPYYNSDQSSQRYVKLKEIKATIPSLDEASKKVFEKAVIESWEIYNKLTEILGEDLKESYKKYYKKEELDKTDLKKIEKKSIETARYVIPIAAHTSLVHTLNALTLYRLYMLMNQFGCSEEIKLIVNKMVEEVKKVSPDFFENLNDPIPLEETIEYQFFKEYANSVSEEFIKDFDSDLGEFDSKLVSWNNDAEKIVADSVRTTTGKTANELSDENAIKWLVDPEKNGYLNSTLNFGPYSPIMRSLNHVFYVFKKRMSHAADSQEQRHRTLPGSRPVLVLTDSKEPDYFTPNLIKNNAEAKKIYDDWMQKIWKIKNELIENGVDKENAIYLLPNALNVRYYESGSLLNFWHKWVLRLCLNAQREIWQHSVQEVEQVKKINPKLVEFLGPHCQLRLRGKIRPFCTEGNLWCGFPVWTWKEMDPKKRIF